MYNKPPDEVCCIGRFIEDYYSIKYILYHSCQSSSDMIEVILLISGKMLSGPHISICGDTSNAFAKQTTSISERYLSLRSILLSAVRSIFSPNT